MHFYHAGAFLSRRFRAQFRLSVWRKGAEMPQVNLVKLEEEMRQFAEQRIQAVAGHAPMLTTTQLAEIWGRSPSWITRMRAAGRIPNVQFGDWPQVPRAVAIMGLVKGV
jgi:hypothetical protein